MKIIVALFLISLSSNSVAFSQQIPIWKELSPFIEELQKDWKVPGVAFAIVTEDSVYYGNYGWAQKGKNKLPVNENTIFSVGSISKTMTSTLFAKGVFIDVVSWDDRVIDHYPNFKLYNDTLTNQTTFTDLLSHKTGIPMNPDLYMKKNRTSDEVMALLEKEKPEMSFRKGFLYSNYNTLIAGKTAEKIMGVPYEELMDQEIFRPLYMRNTTANVNEALKEENIAFPYSVRGKKIPYNTKMLAISPAGGIYSTTKDMAKFLKLFIDEGKTHTERFFSPFESFTMMNPQNKFDVSSVQPEYALKGYSMGWFVTEYHDKKLLYHNGVTEGFSAEISYMPEQKIGVIILTNRFGNPLPFILSRRIYDIYLNKEPIDWNEISKETGGNIFH